MSAKPICANWAKSPLAPTDPFSGITGIISWFKKSNIWLTTTNLTPLYPFTKVRSFKIIIIRTIPLSIGCPTPAAWDRTKFNCNFLWSEELIFTWLNFPNPVVTPYTEIPDFRSDCKFCWDWFIDSFAWEESWTLTALFRGKIGLAISRFPLDKAAIWVVTD